MGPAALLGGGLALCGVVWTARNGPPDHDIGRSIVTSIVENGLAVVGGAAVLTGAIWLMLDLVTTDDAPAT